jgi:hypothetical protein
MGHPKEDVHEIPRYIWLALLVILVSGVLLTEALALGVVLLEIGLWQTVASNTGISLAATVKNAPPGEAPKQIYDKLLHQAKGRLGHRCGDRFRDITAKCLEGEAGDLGDVALPHDKLMTGLQEKYRQSVVEPLAKLAEAV